MALLFALAVSVAARGETLPGGGALGGQPQFLKVDEAFVLTMQLQGERLRLDWRIADGYYLYRSRTSIRAEADSGVVLGPPTFPDGKHKNDEYFGDVEVYYHGLQVDQPIAVSRPGGRIKITYQGCADAGLCYPPTSRWFVLPGSVGAAGSAGGAGTVASAAIATAAGSAPAAGIGGLAAADAARGADSTPPPFAGANANAIAATAIGTAAQPMPSAASNQPASSEISAPIAAERTAIDATAAPEEQRLAGLLAGGSTLTALLLFFVAGIGLAFTPCVLPMVPILSSIIVGQGASASRARAFVLSSAYVLGMALTYAALGVLVGLFGGELNLQARFQSPPVLIASATVFVLLALSMFGLYELQLPAWLRDRMTAASARQRGGQLGSVAVMGALSALIVSPCVSAPLVGALIYLSSTGDALLGGAALLMLGLGMGLPLMVVGVGGAQLLPRAGAWMNQVRAVFGVLLLGVAIWLLERLLPGPLTLALWAALSIGAGVYLGVFERTAQQTGTRSGGARLAQAVGVFALVWGVLLAVGAASGASDPLTPLGKLTASRSEHGAVAAGTPQFTSVADLPALERALAAAASRGRPVMLDLYADWCIACKVMERNVFPEPGVAGALAQFVLLRADITANSDADQALLVRYGLFGPPSLLLFDRTGREQPAFRIQGERNARELQQHLQRFLARS